MEAVWLAGVDGCAAGWMAAFIQPAENELRVRVVPRFADVVFAPEKPTVVAVDMPIGLPERTGPGGRAAENAVRLLLKRRRPSVFSIPSRAAVYSELGPLEGQAEILAAHQRACAVARQTSDPPRGVTIQAFNIFPKIREVDEVLRSDTLIAARVFETHPEVAFWRLNNEQEMSEPKKRRSRLHEPGLAERRKVLIANGFTREAVNKKPPAGVAIDDLLDALACAAIARRIHLGQAKPFPDPPGSDKFGLAMAIWA